MAFHWYDQMMATFNVNATYWLDPSKILLATEGCNCPGVSPNDWSRAEHYGRDILGDIMNWAQGWVDWNLVLDSVGGPNHVHNYCDAMIIAFHKNQSLLIQPSYYYMGQISKYVIPGSVRVSINVNVQMSSNATALPASLAAGDNVVMWKCNGSPSQRWNVTSSGTLALRNSQLCLNTMSTSATASGTNAQLSDCSAVPTTWQIPSANTTGSIVSKANNQCLEVAGASVENSANAQMASCSSAALQQSWLYNATDSTIRSALQPNYCLTAGWSPLNALAFARPDGKVAVIVMNEADVAVSFKLRDVTGTPPVALAASIPAHSIQTYIY
jgi:glucosylceramidase